MVVLSSDQGIHTGLPLLGSLQVHLTRIAAQVWYSVDKFEMVC